MTRFSRGAESLLAVLQAYQRPGAPPTPCDATLAHMLGRPAASITAARVELEAAGLAPGRRVAA